MKLDLLYNKKIAVIAAAVMIVISVFVLGGGRLSREYEIYEAYFYRVSEDNPISIEDELSIICANANNLLVIWHKYLDTDKTTDAITSQVQEMNEADTIKAKHQGYQALTALIGEAIQRLEQESLSEQDWNYVIAIEANVRAAGRKIGNSAYNDYAAVFNRKINNPYSWLIGRVNGVHKLYLFE